MTSRPVPMGHSNGSNHRRPSLTSCKSFKKKKNWKGQFFIKPFFDSRRFSPNLEGFDRSPEFFTVWFFATIRSTSSFVDFSGEPNNANGEEFCNEMAIWNLGAWNDIKCDYHFSYICQKPGEIMDNPLRLYELWL